MHLKAPCHVRGSHPADFTAGEVTQESRVVLIWRVGTLRAASGRRRKTSASGAARLTYQKPVKTGHVGKNARLLALVIGGRRDERKSRGASVKKGQFRA